MLGLGLGQTLIPSVVGLWWGWELLATRSPASGL